MQSAQYRLQNGECDLPSARSGTGPLEEDPLIPSSQTLRHHLNLAARPLPMYSIVCVELMLRERVTLTRWLSGCSALAYRVRLLYCVPSPRLVLAGGIRRCRRAHGATCSGCPAIISLCNLAADGRTLPFAVAEQKPPTARGRLHVVLGWRCRQESAYYVHYPASGNISMHLLGLIRIQRSGGWPAFASPPADSCLPHVDFWLGIAVSRSEWG